MPGGAGWRSRGAGRVVAASRGPRINVIDLAGRVAVVTGGAQGIGYAIAERMLASGAVVVLWDSDERRLAAARAALSALGMVDAHITELTDEASVAGAAAAAIATQGRIDIPSKAGLIALTKSLAKEVATRGVLVNAVSPAAAKTAMFATMTESHIAYMLSRIPMARFMEVHEAAAMVAWLASEECSFTTGSVFDLSGGRATY